ncbi:MAG: helix-turn-helix transcriptional regulator [Actinomycetota bacterium]
MSEGRVVALQGSQIGVGAALRKARMRRGVTIDEASRGTRIRQDALEALEHEEFEALLGEVYVRGTLRTYANYLGLDPEKVLQIYARGAGVSAPATPEPPTELRRRAGHERRRDNHRLAWGVVAIVVIAAAGFGVLSRSGSTPAPATLPGSPVVVDPETSNVVVGVTSRTDLSLRVESDGVEQAVEVRRGEERIFEADDILSLELTEGGPATISVNGTGPLEISKAGKPWNDSFSDTSVIAGSDESAQQQLRALQALEAAREDAVASATP